MEKKYYIWGLDISMKNTGLAVYDLEEGKIVEVTSFSTEKIRMVKAIKGKHLNAIKLKALFDWCEEMRTKYPPYEVAIERMFSRFPTATQIIAKATGVVQLSIYEAPQELYPPKKVKERILSGSATKVQVAKEIGLRYPDIAFENEDESDAFAVLITHLIERGIIKWEKSEVKEKKKATKKKKKKEEVKDREDE